MFKEVMNNRRGVACINCGSIATTSDHKATAQASGLMATGMLLMFLVVTAIVGIPMFVIGFVKSIGTSSTPYHRKVNQPHLHKCKTCKHKWETTTLANEL